MTYLDEDEHLLTEREAAAYLHNSTRTMQRWRDEGGGPPFVRLGMRRIAYRAGDLKAWTAARTFKSRAAELAKQAA